MIPNPNSSEENEKFRKKMWVFAWGALAFWIGFAVYSFYFKQEPPVTSEQLLKIQSVVYIPVRPVKLTPEPAEAASPPAVELPRRPYTQTITIGSNQFVGAIVYMNAEAIPNQSLYMALTPVQCLNWVKEQNEIDGVLFKWNEFKDDFIDKSLIDRYLKLIGEQKPLPYVVRIKN